MTYSMLAAADLGRHADGIIIDVRTAMEHAESRLKRPHAHVPLDRLDPADFMRRHGLGHGDAVYILCRSGNRAKQAADKFNAAGFANVHVIDGGILSCADCGEPVVTQNETAAGANTAPQTRKIMPLERQVRIAAGALVALGGVMGFAVWPGFHLLSLAVGGGLVYAGITDRCGMALLLTRAPWNKVAGGTSCGTASCSKTKTGGSCS